MSKTIYEFFKEERKRIAGIILLQLPLPREAQMTRARPKGLRKSDVNKFVDDIDMTNWSVLIDPVTQELKVVGSESVVGAAAQLKISKSDIVEVAAQEALEYAEERGAELVGMRVLPSGEVIVNPNAYWQIQDETRESLKTMINTAIEEGQSRDTLAINIMKDEHPFNASRAKMIAQTELNFAQSKSNDEVWEKSGIVESRVWLLATTGRAKFLAEHGPDPCDMNARAGEVKMGKLFPSGHNSPPVHPRCLCDIAAVVSP